MNPLPVMKINGVTGRFESEGLTPVNSLEVTLLRMHHGQQFYSGKLEGKGSGAAPICHSENGIIPALPGPSDPTAPRYSDRALSDTCAACSLNKPTLPKDKRCMPLWSADLLLATGVPVHLVISRLSQDALFQWEVQLKAEIVRMELELGLRLRPVDFSFTLKLEKRQQTTKLYSLAYPWAGSSGRFTLIPFVGGTSKFDSIYEDFIYENFVQAATRDEAVLKAKERELRGSDYERVPVSVEVDDSSILV